MNKKRPPAEVRLTDGLGPSAWWVPRFEHPLVGRGPKKPMLWPEAEPLYALTTEEVAAVNKLRARKGRTAKVTREMIGAAHDIMLARGDFVLSAALLERIYLAMEQAAPPRQTPFDTCPTCEALNP